jgi:ZIP family zinc transporter
VVSRVRSFGAAVLNSALASGVVHYTVSGGRVWPTVAGFLTGAAVYVAANTVLARRGAEHWERSTAKQPGGRRWCRHLWDH